MPRLPAVGVRPEGLAYEPDFVAEDEERALVALFEQLEFSGVHPEPAVLGHLPDTGPSIASLLVTSRPTYVEFQPDRVEEIVAAMESGAGWVNFEPAVDVEDVAAAGSSTFSIFSGRGPVVPLGTWTPASTGGRGRREPAMLGLQHPAGSKAKPLLAELGHPVPDGWVVVQDHVRKGLVVAVPETVAAADALAWLLRAARLLSTVPLQGGWRAAIYPG